MTGELAKVVSLLESYIENDPVLCRDAAAVATALLVIAGDLAGRNSELSLEENLRSSADSYRFGFAMGRAAK